MQLMQAVAGEHLAGGEPINTMMNKYGIIKGETEENPIKTASDEIVEEVEIDKKEEEDDSEDGE